MRAKLAKSAPFILLGLVFLMLVFLNIFYQDQWMDSDMAAEMVFSRVLAEGGHIFATPDWYYATEFKFLFTHLIMGPLLRIMDNWHVIRTITQLVYYALIIVAYFYVMKPLKISKGLTALAACVVLLPFSETMMFYMQMSNFYIPHSLIILVFYGMFLRLAGKVAYKKWQKAVLLVCYVLLGVCCGLSGIRYMLAMQGPLVVAGFFYWLSSDAFKEFRAGFGFGDESAGQDAEKLSKDTDAKSGKSRILQPGIVNEATCENGKKLLKCEEAGYFYYSLLGVVCSLAGYVINAVWVSRQYVFQTYESTNFIAVYQGEFLERLQNAFGSLLMFFGYIPQKSVLSLRGIISVIAFVLIGIFVFCTRRAYKSCKGIRFFAVMFVIVAFAVNVFAFVFTNSTMVPRYYITIMIFALPVIAMYLEEEKVVFDKTLVFLILAACLFLSSAKTFYSYITVDKNAPKREVAAFLAENDYDFGFATFDNANVITELTNGEVEIAHIWNIDDMDFFKWSSPVKYYEDGYHTGETFLLLTTAETVEFADSKAVERGEAVYEDEYYTVYVYENVEALLECGSGR